MSNTNNDQPFPEGTIRANLIITPPAIAILKQKGFLAQNETDPQKIGQAVGALFLAALKSDIEAGQQWPPPARQPKAPKPLTPEEERALRTAQQFAAIQDDTVGADEQDWSRNLPPELTTRPRA